MFISLTYNICHSLFNDETMYFQQKNIIGKHTVIFLKNSICSRYKMKTNDQKIPFQNIFADRFPRHQSQVPWVCSKTRNFIQN